MIQSRPVSLRRARPRRGPLQNSPARHARRARVARRGHDVSIMSANPHGSPEEIPMRLFSSRPKRTKQTSLTPRRLSSPWRTFKPRLEQLEERTLLNAGALDSAFGIGGKVTTHFGGFDNGRELAIQPDGKIVVVGSEVVNGVSDFGLARYNSDGSLDSTFGT